MIFNSLYSLVSFKNKEEMNISFFQDLKFKYGEASYQKFSKIYSSKGCYQRKIFAIPKLIQSVSKVFIHFLFLITRGIPKAYKKDNSELKVNSFKILRDIEQSYGFFLLIFLDKLGLYLIQKSKFQKKCYCYYLHFKKRKKISEIFFKNELAILEQNYSHYILNRIFESSSKGIERYHALHINRVEKILQSHPSSFFFEHLTNHQCKSLNYFQLDKHVILNILQNTKMGYERYQSLSNEVKNVLFQKFEIDDIRILPKYLQKDYLSKISVEELKKCNFRKINLDNLVFLFNFKIQERKRSIKHLSAQQIQDIISRLQERHYWFLTIITKNQLQGLNLELIGATKFYWLANHKNAFSQFTSEQLQKILTQLSSSYLRQLTSLQLKHLDLSQLSSSKINKIFYRNNFAWNDLNEMSTKNLQKILLHLDIFLIKKIHPNKLKKLDLTELKDEIQKELQNKE